MQLQNMHMTATQGMAIFIMARLTNFWNMTVFLFSQKLSGQIYATRNKHTHGQPNTACYLNFKQ